MVAVIHSSQRLRSALNYNEQKLQQGKAVCLSAENYPMDADEMNFHQKLNRLINQAALRPSTKVNSVHISLNFDPFEKLSPDTLREVAGAYMDKIGFGKQPYLVYDHRDAGHPHLHIVTTNITSDGERIELHNLGRNQSEIARKAVEEEFGLVKADSKKLQEAQVIKPVNAQKVQYGKSETKRAITNVLDAVLSQYKFTSLPELNAVLNLYNVAAERGGPDSRTFKRHGLVYRVLDEQGNKVGVPIKASSIYSKPTLAWLQSRFEQHDVARQAHAKRIKTAIDWYFVKAKNAELTGLVTALQKEGITVVLRQNAGGLIYGITYIDHKTKCVFNGSDLGKTYTAKGLQDRIQPVLSQETKLQPAQKPWQTPQKSTGAPPSHMPTEVFLPATGKHDATNIPVSVERQSSLPIELRTNQRKKKKRKRFWL
jgi:hypothetical protein